ncbi:hypothetical protein BRC81_11345 [Halobacteriales archaeon QS_1_68_20]|nr:MAG: hypothetical protein BRC81_11345 [Halobacteriales archaeon QS_1_68_20]
MATTDQLDTSTVQGFSDRLRGTVLQRGDDGYDEVACYGMLTTVPPEPPFPEEHHGDTAVALIPSYSGPGAEGEEELRPIREFGDPIFDGVGPIPTRRYSRASTADNRRETGTTSSPIT